MDFRYSLAPAILLASLSQLTAQDLSESRNEALGRLRNWTESVHAVGSYTSILVLRERVDGKLGDLTYIHLKVRRDPKSLYMYFLKPDSVKRRELLFVDGKHEGKIAYREGGRGCFRGPYRISPSGALGMRGHRHPWTQLDVASNLAKATNLLADSPNSRVVWKDGRINGRLCAVAFVNFARQDNSAVQQLRLFCDNELKLPIRFATLGWPKEPGGEPLLLEEYTYLDLDLQPEFTDLDFDQENPAYSLSFIPRVPQSPPRKASQPGKDFPRPSGLLQVQRRCEPPSRPKCCIKWRWR